MKIAIVGMGEIGTAVYKEVKKKYTDIVGIDKGDKMPIVSTYIICVYTTDQVFEVLETIKQTKPDNPLILIESTIQPSALKSLKKFYEGFKCDLALFPHRYNPDDPEHYVFNLNRVIAGIDPKSTDRALSFVSEFMTGELHVTSFETALYTKPLENAYRFLEIAFAEGLKLWCEIEGLDFEELRKAASTKWNIEIKEARDGIGGKCLPKDTEMLKEIPLLIDALTIDKKYKEKFGGE